ncbi:MAG: pentapeptide repeat-containing protein [Alphaproteobacteria bacterium]|nr:pentapeptide repeat-containing protein [Alphaproteobacteria bacterium]
MTDDSPPDMPEQDGPNPEHLAILRQGVEVWNKWWEENPNIRPNLTGVDLRGADLRGYNLRLAILRKAKLGGADLKGADLTYANISTTDLSESVHLTQNQIDDAYGNRLTLLSPGLKHPEHWEKGRSSFADYFFKPFSEPDDQTGPKSPLRNIQSPIPMDWNAEGKITVVPPQERPPAHGLSPATRDLLAQAQIDAATDLANLVLESNGDRRIAEKLQSYAREAAKGGPELNILRLDAIVRTLRNLAARDEDAFSPIVAAEFEVFTGDHGRLTRFYPDFEDYQRALDLATDNIPAPPDTNLAKIMREPPGPDIIDASVLEAVDDFLPPVRDLLNSTGAEQQESKERKITFMKIVLGIGALLALPPATVASLDAISILVARLQPYFDWLMTSL